MSDRFTDNDLQAWLAGEAEPDRARAIDAALEAGDAALERRLAALDPFSHVHGTALTTAFDALLGDAPTDRLRDGVAPAPSAPAIPPARRMVVFGGIAAVFAAAFAGGVWIGARPPFRPAESTLPRWVVYVEEYLRLYTADTFAGAPIDPYAWADSLVFVGERVGVDLTRLADLPGLRFQRAQLLDLGSRPLAQVIYLDESDRPFAVCVILRDLPPEAAAATPDFNTGEIENFHVVHWDIQPRGFLVMGVAEESRLTELARIVVDRTSV